MVFSSGACEQRILQARDFVRTHFKTKHILHPFDSSCCIYHVCSHELTLTSISLYGDVLLAYALCTHGKPDVPTSDLASGACMQLDLVHCSVCCYLTLLIMLVALTSCLVPVAVPLVSTCL